MEYDKKKSCLNCPDRHLHCHATCEDHASRCETNRKIQEARRKVIEDRDFYLTVHSKNKPKGRYK